MRKRLIYFAPLAIIGFAVFITLGGIVVRELWNRLLPELFHWKAIGFWQALGLLALCRILFGGFRLHGGPRQHFRRGMFVRWEQMTPEERERFRKGVRERVNCGVPVSDDTSE
jgi:hypothetical protein